MSRHGLAGLIAGVLAFAAVPPLEAQAQAQAEPAFLSEGTAAPEFAIPGGTRWGTLAEPVSLSDFKGKTVVLAFFPAARTRGCTIQMQTYRDEYQRVFNGGRDVVLIAISKDPVETLADWAAEEDFPFLFASDADGSVYRSFGGVPAQSGHLGRTLIVIDGDGQIAQLLPRFREVDPTAYDELEAIVDRLTPANDAG